MTDQLIPVFTGEIGRVSQNVVDGRTLHAFLGGRAQFGNWICVRIKQYDFQEDTDFIRFNKIIKSKGRGGDRKSTDYHLTLDMAKELSMVERTPKGKEARRYFIECERQLLRNLAAQPPVLPLRDRLAVRKEIRITLQEMMACKYAPVAKIMLMQVKRLSAEIGESLETVLTDGEIKALNNNKGEGLCVPVAQ